MRAGSLNGFTFLSALIRLILAMLAGGIIGYGRSKRERAAGFRTYMLVSLGAALAALIAVYEFEMLNTEWAAVVADVGQKFDAGRLAAQTISGIGFMGAGIIIKASHQQVKGLTTATGLFAAVCMGIAAGVGYYWLVIIVMTVVVLVLNVMSPLEAAFKRRLRNITLSVEFSGPEDIEQISRAIEAEKATIYDIDIEHLESQNGHMPSAIFILKLSRENHSHSGMLTTLAELPCVISVQELIS